MIFLSLVLVEKVIGASNLLSLGLSERDHHGVHGFWSVHDMRL
jgi:hypothetical protein